MIENCKTKKDTLRTHNLQFGSLTFYHKSVFTSFGNIQMTTNSICNIYLLIPKMHKNPYTHRFITGSAKCTTKPLSILLTKLLTHIQRGLQKYCETACYRSGVNKMWILKNSKEHLTSPNFNHTPSIKSFYFLNDPLSNYFLL